MKPQDIRTLCYYGCLSLAAGYFWFWLALPVETSPVQSIATMAIQWYKRSHPTPQKRYGYFLHITDMHIDESYRPGATVDSDCHRLPLASSRTGRLTLRQQAALASNTSTAAPELAGTLGTPGRDCDSPIALARQTLDWIEQEWKHKLDFVIWTGDNARHDWDDKYKRKRKHIYSLNQQIQQMMMDTFGPTEEDPRWIPLVPAIGNNDIHPHNFLEQDDHGLLAFYSQLWQPWIPDDQQPTFQKGGYFAVDVGPQMRVLSMNTLYFYSKNSGVRDCHKPGLAHDHMQWFADQLALAKQDRVKVLVMGHVPPSPRDYRPSCFQQYTQLSSEYADLVQGHLYGHLNMDHFLLYGDEDNSQLVKPDSSQLTDGDNGDDPEVHVNRNIEKYVGWLQSMYSSLLDDLEDEKSERDDSRALDELASKLVVVQVSPSVLPVYLPTLRVFRYEINDDDQSSTKKPHGTLLGFNQYLANITQWDQTTHLKNTPLDYTLEYTTEDAYGLRDLTPKSYYDLVKHFVQEEQRRATDGLWATYIRNMFVQTLDFDLSPM